MTPGLEMEWDYTSWKKRRDKQKKKIGKTNEERKRGKVNKSKRWGSEWTRGKGGAPGPCGALLHLCHTGQAQPQLTNHCSTVSAVESRITFCHEQESNLESMVSTSDMRDRQKYVQWQKATDAYRGTSYRWLLSTRRPRWYRTCRPLTTTSRQHLMHLALRRYWSTSRKTSGHSRRKAGLRR